MYGNGLAKLVDSVYGNFEQDKLGHKGVHIEREICKCEL